jgi:hypothetical protein
MEWVFIRIFATEMLTKANFLEAIKTPSKGILFSHSLILKDHKLVTKRLFYNEFVFIVYVLSQL